MLPIISRRAFVPVCLALGTLLLVSPLFADAPAASSAQTAAVQTVVLQHVVPADVVKMLHWDLSSNLPAGVTQIQALPTQNALAVTGTSAGFAKVQQIIKLVDIEPRQVQITFVLAHASDADLDTSGLDFDIVPFMTPPPSPQFYRVLNSSAPAVGFLRTLTRQGNVALTQVLTTTNNVKGSISRDSVELAVTPRVNSDNSVTIALDSVFTVGTVKHSFSTLRTIKNGDTLLLALPFADPQTGKGNSLLFVTPTIK